MNVWDWVGTYDRTARESGNTAQIELSDVFSRAMDLYRTEPDECLDLLNEARSQAQRLNETWWVMLCDHWLMQTMMHGRYNYHDSLDLAVRTVVEVRKPTYDQMPQRICVHEDLISCYSAVDPFGYADQIQAALDYMDKEIAPTVDCRFCLQGLKCSFTLRIQRFEETEAHTARYMAMAEESGSSHYLSHAMSFACTNAYRHKDWTLLLDLAKQGELHARRKNDPMENCEFLIIKAVAAYSLGTRGEATRWVRLAQVQAQRLKVTLSQDYFDWLAIWHEITDDYEGALAIREQQQTIVVKMGSPYRLSRTHLERCRLLKMMGTLTDSDLEAARTSGQGLLQPVHFLTRLDAIAAGDTSEIY
jgi:hypothetical protein